MDKMTADAMTDAPSSRHEGTATLVVLLHAYTSSPGKLASVASAIARSWPRAQIYAPELPASLLSMADPDQVVADILINVDRLVLEADSRNESFDRIVLVGHSLGALLVRKLYVVACGEVEEAPLEAVYRSSAGLVRARPWAAKVERLVLLAGMNRGWHVSHHLSLTHAPVWALGSAFCFLIHFVTGRWPLIFTIRRGAEFITQLRIQWLLMRQRANGLLSPDCRPDQSVTGRALTVQLLGSRDDMVAPEDNVDLVSGGDFVYLDVPLSGHADVIEFDDPVAGGGRREVFCHALVDSPEDLRAAAVIPSDERFLSPNLAVKRLVFVIHGIRDVGYWTHKIARRVKQRARDTHEEWATETSSYGYFPMLPFLFPWYRRQKVEWLMDQYTEALARYPNARDSISYVGHSNGTYLVAKALEIYPCCRFRNVVFAGSVVRRRYDWKRLLNAAPPRVNAVLNFTATSDWVVAFFPKIFELIRVQDLGSGGHDGFVLAGQTPGCYEIGYVKGRHSAAIEEPMWDAIADFVISGQPPPASEVVAVSRRRNPLVSLLGRFPPIVWAGIAAALWLGWMIVDWLVRGAIDDAGVETFVRGFALAAYLLAIWLAVTRI